MHKKGWANSTQPIYTIFAHVLYINSYFRKTLQFQCGQKAIINQLFCGNTPLFLLNIYLFRYFHITRNPTCMNIKNV